MDIVAYINEGITPRLVLVSGLSGIGKTTWCRALVVVRPSLLELARGTWFEFDIKVHMHSG